MVAEGVEGQCNPDPAGESSLGPTAGAFANAVANATARRIRDLPFTSDRVKLALG